MGNPWIQTITQSVINMYVPLLKMNFHNDKMTCRPAFSHSHIFACPDCSNPWLWEIFCNLLTVKGIQCSQFCCTLAHMSIASTNFSSSIIFDTWSTVIQDEASTIKHQVTLWMSIPKTALYDGTEFFCIDLWLFAHDATWPRTYVQLLLRLFLQCSNITSARICFTN